MRTNILKKALTLLMALALMIPFIPVIASATDYTYEYRTFTEADTAWYGDGSATEFTIKTVGELAYFMSLGQGAAPQSFNNKTIKLGADIEWNTGTASSTGFVPASGTVIYKWEPYANDQTTGWNQFRGTFDGQGHTISGLYIKESTNYIGFIGISRDGQVKNLTIENSYLTGEGDNRSYFGVAVATSIESTSGSTVVSNVAVKNCHINAAGSYTRSNAGGIYGGTNSDHANNKVEISGCVVDKDTTIVGKGSVGGIVGMTRPSNTLTLTDCINYATISGENEVAGLVGTLASKAIFTRCTSFGKVSASANASKSAIWATMRYANNGTDVKENEETDALELPDKPWNCKYVSFIDCFYPDSAANTRNFPIWVANSATMVPAFRVLVFYSSVCSNIDTTKIDGTSLNRAYYNGSTYSNNLTEYAIATNFQNALVGYINSNKEPVKGAYPKARFELDAPATGDVAVKVQGVQTKANGTDKFDVRFVASVDVTTALNTTDVKQIGFEISRLTDYSNADLIKAHACPEVYTSIVSSFGEETISAEANFGADYLATMVVTGIPKAGAQALLVRTYYSTSTDAADRVYGAYALVTCVNGEIVDTRYLTEYVETVEGASQALASSYNTETYDLAPLLPEGASDISVKASKGQTVNGTTVSLNVGENYFEVTYTEGGEEKSKTIAIARRAGHRVVFNSNGGSYIAPQSVADGGKLTYNDSFEPKREGYEFLGWFKQDGTRFYFDSGIVNEDMMLVAHWKAPEEPAETDTDDALTYSTSSAAINVVWKDYANAFSARPASMTCTLSEGTNSYKVVVTENNASFANGAPAGAEISTGAGNWTVKITGLDGTKNYTFTADDLSTNAYEKQQSGTAVTYTLNGYKPMLDDSAWLMTQNGRLYDYAGNVVVLKGVVTYNVGWSGFADNVSMAALTRLQSEGVNCIRLTVFVENASSNIGYHLAKDGTEQTETVRAELRRQIKVAIDNASSLGMYCIVDWGILASIEMTDAVNATAKELFVTLATDYKDNPYVIYEICNEPAPDTWGSTVVPYAEDVIAAIRAHSNALVILAPDAAATNLSEYSPNPGDDPIDKPLDTALTYSVAYTYHCYAASHKYSGNPGETFYGWKIKDALDAGLTLVWTEFSPAVATMSSNSLTIDEAAANKFLNVILENDMSFMLFRYMSGGEKDSAQYMFQPNHTDDLNEGTWTYDMLQNSGKWFYDNALDSDGFIKAADFNC